MRQSLRAALLVIPMCLPLAGWTQGPELLSLQSQSKLWVEGGSTIRAWTCKADDINATVEASGTNSVALLITGDKTVRTVNVTIPSEKLECGNGTMNDHMKKALKVKEFPTIAFTLATYDLTHSAAGVSGTLIGTLSLGGVKKSVAIAATGTEENGALRVLGSYDLKMTDYDLTPPSLMFGRIKVRENVTVKFDLILKS
ncbi:MAG: YceI family protein [bacterium]